MIMDKKILVSCDCPEGMLVLILHYFDTSNFQRCYKILNDSNPIHYFGHFSSSMANFKIMQYHACFIHFYISYA